MTAMTATATPTQRALALALSEIRLIVRNRTVAVASILIPLALGVFWAFSFGGDPTQNAVVIALQLAVTFGLGIYQTATQTVVARRHSGVLKRLRTSSLTDRGLLAATVAPAVVLGILQLAIFAVFDALSGTFAVSDPLPLVLAVLGGIALVVTAALATSVITPSPERSQITTLPLMMVMLAGAVVLAVAPVTGWWQALVLLPGAGLGQLVQLAGTGQAWSAGFAGLPVLLPAVVALVVWSVVFAATARRRFRWDPRH